LWSVGRFDLGLGDVDFWRLTLRQYDALVKRLIFNNELRQWETARLMAAIYEQNRNPKKKPSAFSASDFMPRKNDPSSLLEKVKGINRMLGGKMIPKE